MSFQFLVYVVLRQNVKFILTYCDGILIKLILLFMFAGLKKIHIVQEFCKQMGKNIIAHKIVIRRKTKVLQPTLQLNVLVVIGTSN